MIPIQKNQIEMFQKKSKKAWMFSTYVCTNYRKKSDPNSNCTVKNKKDKFSMNSVNKDKKHEQCEKIHDSQQICLFFILNVYIELGSEYILGFVVKPAVGSGFTG